METLRWGWALSGQACLLKAQSLRIVQAQLTTTPDENNTRAILFPYHQERREFRLVGRDLNNGLSTVPRARPY